MAIQTPKEALEHMLSAYFPNPEFTTQVEHNLYFDALKLSVRHVRANRVMYASIDRSIQPLFDAMKKSVEALARQAHCDLAAHGHSDPCSPNILSGPVDMFDWRHNDMVRSEHEQTVTALLYLTGWELRCRHVQGIGDELGHAYYLVKNGIARDVPQQFLTASVNAWKMFLSALQ